MSFGYALHPPAGGTQRVVRAPCSATGAHRARRERQHARCRRPCLCRRRHGRRRRRGRKAQAAWPRVVLGGVHAGGTDLYAGVMTSRGSIVHGVVNTRRLAAPLSMMAARFADGAEIRLAPVLAKQRSFAEHPRRGERSCAVPCAAQVCQTLASSGKRGRTRCILPSNRASVHPSVLLSRSRWHVCDLLADRSRLFQEVPVREPDQVSHNLNSSLDRAMIADGTPHWYCSGRTGKRALTLHAGRARGRQGRH